MLREYDSVSSEASRAASLDLLIPEKMRRMPPVIPIIITSMAAPAISAGRSQTTRFLFSARRSRYCTESLSGTGMPASSFSRRSRTNSISFSDCKMPRSDTLFFISDISQSLLFKNRSEFCVCTAELGAYRAVGFVQDPGYLKGRIAVQRREYDDHPLLGRKR